jgi:retron-type reverse transcriptase
VDLLREAYRRTRKDGAPGIDAVTAQEYAEPLEANLANLNERLRRGRYRAPPVRCTNLDKEDSSQRRIGIPAFEAKLVQRAVVRLLGAIYEQDFCDRSHSFHEGHSPHQAPHELREQCMELDIGWIVDENVSACFDSLDHDLW